MCKYQFSFCLFRPIAAPRPSPLMKNDVAETGNPLHTLSTRLTLPLFHKVNWILLQQIDYSYYTAGRGCIALLPAALCSAVTKKNEKRRKVSYKSNCGNERKKAKNRWLLKFCEEKKKGGEKRQRRRIRLIRAVIIVTVECTGMKYIADKEEKQQGRRDDHHHVLGVCMHVVQ